MSLVTADRPFVLLDDARPGGRSLLLTDPDALIVARRQDEVLPALAQMEAAAGRELAGFLSYEAGFALEPKLAPLAPEPGALPLVWFGQFDAAREVDVPPLLPDPAGAWSGAARPGIERADYDAALARLNDHILAGDIYQANFTYQADVPVAGHPLALYAALRQRAGAGHGAVIFTGTHWVLSFSPELFFTSIGGKVAARPMKGTAPRMADLADDAAAVRDLAADEKQRAENLMIVDLIRNDLSRVSQPGSVKVPELFRVETYPTVHQLVSSVTARLKKGLGAMDIVRALFPCGSITGAPKIRAMEILRKAETEPRGIYCGSIGRIAANGDAAFNVAIRTLVMEQGASSARLGLGSGIVADSRAASEWEECRTKGAFVATTRRFDLIETMRFDPYEGLIDLERHLGRLKASAELFGFVFDRHDARNELQAATFGAKAGRVRLRVSRTGAMCIDLQPLPAVQKKAVKVAVMPLPVDPRDMRLAHKTSDRSFYDAARVASGAFEVVFADAEGRLTEGSFTSLFVERNGMLLTPPLARGLLPGVLRERLIDEGLAFEADLTVEDLAGGFQIGNSLRGLMRARLA